MSANSAIEWTDATWNPVVGCDKVSPGCAHCYAKQLHDKRHKAHQAGKAVPAQYARPFEVVQLMPDRLDDPIGWRSPRRVFVNSVSDLFHDDVPFDFIDRVFATMGVAHWHTFQVLTKRPARMAEYFAETYQVPASPAGRVHGVDIPATPARIEDRWARINAACDDITIHRRRLPERCWTEDGNLVGRPAWPRRPFPNVWIGVSVENRKHGLPRVEDLRRTPAAVRFLSVEPLLENLGTLDLTGIHWVIVGGESGPGARPCRPAWVRSVVEQCRAAGVAAFVKQLGENIVDRNDQFGGWEPHHWPETLDSLKVEHDIHGFREDHQGADCRVRLLDRKGGDPAEWPADLRVREFPSTTPTTEATR